MHSNVSTGGIFLSLLVCLNILKLFIDAYLLSQCRKKKPTLKTNLCMYDREL